MNLAIKSVDLHYQYKQNQDFVDPSVIIHQYHVRELCHRSRDCVVNLEVKSIDLHLSYHHDWLESSGMLTPVSKQWTLS